MRGMQTESTAGDHSWRAPGLLLLLGIVVLGLLSGAIPFRIKAPEVRAGIIADLAEKKREATTPAKRLDAWMSFGVPQIENRLQMLSFSASMPYLLAHGIRQPEGLVEVWGVDFLRHGAIQVERDGLVLRIHVPQPHRIGTGVLQGDNAGRVPLYDSLELVPDPNARVKELVEWFLGGMQSAISADIEGAQLEIVVDLAPQEPKKGP